MQRLHINPLLGKELRIRMRNWRTFGMISLYLLVLGGFSVLFFLSNYYLGVGSLADVGRNMFSFLAVVQHILVIFLVPSLVGNAISGEKERQTIDLLTCTQLTPFRIVIGKLTAALSTVVLLIFASLPLYGFVFLLGGVSPLEVLKLFLITLVGSLFVGCWTLLFSSLLKRTVAAIVTGYAVVLFCLGGSAILFSLLASLFYNTAGATSYLFIILAINPLSLLGWLFPDFFSGVFSLLSPSWGQWGLQLWHVAFLVQGGLAAVSLWLATRAVNPLKSNRHAG